MVGIRILEYALTRAGFRVVNSGSQCSQQECIEAARETAADAILISSVYGMGEIDCRGFGNRCQKAGLGHLVKYVGGNLVVAAQTQDWSEITKRFQAMGFDRVYSPATRPPEVIAALRRDLAGRGVAATGG